MNNTDPVHLYRNGGKVVHITDDHKEAQVIKERKGNCIVACGQVALIMRGEVMKVSDTFIVIQEPQ